jgi:hypothetical protein
VIIGLKLDGADLYRNWIPGAFVFITGGKARRIRVL